MARDYSPKGVKFYYVYKTLAHPAWNNYVAPFDLDERRLHVVEAQRSLRTSIPWLYDGMSNAFAQAMGQAPNSEFIVGPDGKIVKSHGWNSPKRLREELAELLGPVDNPTRPEDLNLPAPKPIAAAATGVVPRLERPEFMRPLRLKPKQGEDGEPFYAKLRAEATRSVLSKGEGQLYLGFLLDPLYNVHWNNLSEPIHVEVTSSEAVEIDPASQDGPKVEAEADADPREFLFDVRNWGEGDRLQVFVYYFACNDDEGWCKPIKQSYTLSRKSARGSGFTFRPQYGNRINDGLDWLEGKLPEPKVTATEEQLSAVRGLWSMQTGLAGQAEKWQLVLVERDGRLAGWTTYDRAEPTIYITAFDGKELRFLQLSGPSSKRSCCNSTAIQLQASNSGAFGDFPISGKRGPDEVESNPESETDKPPQDSDKAANDKSS